jgi:Tol biopolymer transport system component/serine/threonine protein kinase
MDQLSLVGQQLGKFYIEAELGRGAMGIVFRARDDLDRTVALKVLPPELTVDQSYVERFKREAKSAANLHHPHIITIYEVGQIDKLHYISMFFIEGETLTNVMQREGAMSAGRVADLLEPVAQALDRAHSSGIIHRDIKPSNIMISQDHTIYLTDFGLARSADPAAMATAAGMVLGTPEYMSPEQAQGLSEIGPSTDIYALGIVAYQMLSGALPFSGETTMMTLFARLKQPPRPLSELRADIGPAVEAAVMKALELEPQNRYAQASELIAALRAAATGEPAQPAPAVGDSTIVLDRKSLPPEPAPDATMMVDRKSLPPEPAPDATMMMDHKSMSPTPGIDTPTSPQANGKKKGGPPLGIIGGVVVVLLLLAAGGGAWAMGIIPPGDDNGSTPTEAQGGNSAEGAAVDDEETAEPEPTDEEEEEDPTEPPVVAAEPLDNQIVFVSNREDSRDIYVMDADGSNQTSLIATDDDETAPTVSPDGTQIAFVSEDDIYVANADGSEPQNLTGGEGENNYPTWSPDGTRLGFVRDEMIVIMNADGSDPAPITEDTGNYRDLDWSPDGELFVFELDQDIYLINSDGSEMRPLTDSDEDRDVEPAWSPDGTQIAFASDRDARSFDVYVMDADGRNATRLTEDENVDRLPTWSPDGTQIAFRSGRDRNDEIYVIDSSGGEPARLTDTENRVDDTAPDWSP